MYHVGIVVKDVRAACARLTELIGVDWGPIVEREAAFFDAAGRERMVSMQICHSTEAPYLELIREAADTPWVCNEQSNLHHIGYFADSVEEHAADGVRAGCPFEFGARGEPGTPLLFAYHRGDLAARVEFTSESRRATIETVYTRPVPFG